MDFELRGKMFNMQMPSDWKYYPEGLLVLPECCHTSFSGELRDENGTPVDVIVQKSLVWGGHVVNFRNYSLEKQTIYQKFGVFKTEEAALLVGRMILACNRAMQYNWSGITSIIMRGDYFDLDTAMAIAFLYKLLPKTKQLPLLFNPTEEESDGIVNPVVFVERKDLEDPDDRIEAQGITRKSKSYTRMFMLHYIHHIPGISFFNEDAFVEEVMEFVKTGAHGKFEADVKLGPEEFSEIVTASELMLYKLFDKYANSRVPVEYLEGIVDDSLIVKPDVVESFMRAEQSKEESEDSKEEASDEA